MKAKKVTPAEAGKKKTGAGGLGRALWLAAGTFLSVLGVLGVALGIGMLERLTGALVLGVGTVVLLLGFMFERLAVFTPLLRHVQYLTQASEYTARLLREITEVMRSIQQAELEERKTKQANPGHKGDFPDAEELEFEKAVRQFEE